MKKKYIEDSYSLSDNIYLINISHAKNVLNNFGYLHGNIVTIMDEKLLKRLAKYKIVHCLKETLTKPIEGGSLMYKQMSPIFGSSTHN